MTHKGSCHCGKFRYEVEGDIGEVTECNCYICRRRVHLLWFMPRDKLHLKTPESHLSTYSFNKRRIKHRFCPTCGSATFGEGSDSKGNKMAAINMRCLEEMELSNLKINQFDGRSL
ncbi:MAG TPA: GFA family protein [Gammaproteobacteria bacterium]|nr:GFA family protein [Gammaproteobacteria bacterium]